MNNSLSRHCMLPLPKKFILLSKVQVYLKGILCRKYENISVLVVYLYYFNTPWD